MSNSLAKLLRFLDELECGLLATVGQLMTC
jgi:hypothetical protein